VKPNLTDTTQFLDLKRQKTKTKISTPPDLLNSNRTLTQGPGVLETKRPIVIETHFTPVYQVGSLPTKTRVKSFETRPKTFISKGTQGLSTT
jgi:hypothetical protein